MFGRRFFGGRFFGGRYFGDGDDDAVAIPQTPGFDYPRNVKALSIIEGDFDRCSRTYGIAPCSAAIGVTGERKCFNTRRTCQDRANFLNDPVTLRFAKPTAYLPREFEAIPSIEAINYDPGIISLGEGLGQRASLSVTFKDHPWSDTGTGFDPYLAARDYDPYRQGSFWPKFRARQPFVQGRALRWLDGRLGQSTVQMDTRHFVVESFNGPSMDGRFTLVAKDILKLADNDRAQWPPASTGRLSGSMTTGTTSVTLTPSGIGNSEYAAFEATTAAGIGAGLVNIGGKEICAYTRVNDTLTLTRAQIGTVASTHAAQDRVQVVERLVAMDPADMLHRWLTLGAGVDEDFINLDGWQEETAAHYRQLMTGTVAEPTGVNQLVSEVIEQAALAMWWEPLTQQIRLQVLRAITTDAERFTPANTVKGSLSIKEQPEKRLSQVWVFYGQSNPLDDLEKESNFAGSQLVVETDAEIDYGAAKIKKIFSRWIASGGSAAALRLGNILLAQYKDPPRRFTFKLAKHAAETPTLGEGCRLQAYPLQDDTGAAADVPIQITRLGLDDGQYSVEAEESNFASIDGDDLTNRQVTISADAYNVNLRSLHDEVYPTPVDGDSVNFIVESWVVVGSVSTLSAAIDTGDWPAGVTVTLTVRGRIQGAGGNGGRGRSYGIADARQGSPGGPALKVRAPIDLIDADGRIWSGGGGGGGAGVLNLAGHQGGGGGGGAGEVGGRGGVSNYEDGYAGSLDAGGIGGTSFASFSFSTWPGPTGVRGGSGGLPGQFGEAGGDHGGGNPGEPGNGAGGLPGASIDGISLVTTIGAEGDRRGAQIN